MKNESIHYLIVHISGRQLQLSYTDICYMKGQGTYTEVLTKENRYIVCIGLAKLEKQCKSFGFLRIHRSFLVNTHWIEQFNNKELQINDEWLPISSVHKDALLGMLKPIPRRQNK